MNPMFDDDDPEFNEFMMQFLTGKQGREPIESFAVPMNGNKDESLRKKWDTGNKKRMGLDKGASVIVGKKGCETKAPRPEYMR